MRYAWLAAMAELVLPAGLKMQRLMAALRSGISPLDFCTLFALYSETDRRTGITELSHEELAGLLGMTKPTIGRSTGRLAGGEVNGRSIAECVFQRMP
jgi:hypothetical protein